MHNYTFSVKNKWFRNIYIASTSYIEEHSTKTSAETITDLRRRSVSKKLAVLYIQICLGTQCWTQTFFMGIQ